MMVSDGLWFVYGSSQVGNTENDGWKLPSKHPTFDRSFGTPGDMVKGAHLIGFFRRICKLRLGPPFVPVWCDMVWAGSQHFPNNP